MRLHGTFAFLKSAAQLETIAAPGKIEKMRPALATFIQSVLCL